MPRWSRRLWREGKGGEGRVREENGEWVPPKFLDPALGAAFASRQRGKNDDAEVHGPRAVSPRRRRRTTADRSRFAGAVAVWRHTQLDAVRRRHSPGGAGAPARRPHRTSCCTVTTPTTRCTDRPGPGPAAGVSSQQQPRPPRHRRQPLHRQASRTRCAKKVRPQTHGNNSVKS